jgi:regulator of protease activity HflC (stomatin/prohibitin superfamily)
MLDKLLEYIVQLWDYIAPFEIVKEYEAGVVLRWGRFNRSIGPGFNPKWPFMEYAITCKTCVTTLRLPPQTLTTKDGKSMVVSAIVKYQIRDSKAFLLEIWDAVDVLADTTMGAIKDSIQGSTYNDLWFNNPEVPVLEKVRKEVNQYGFKVHKITFVDFGMIRSIRLLQQTAGTDIVN